MGSKHLTSANVLQQIYLILISAAVFGEVGRDIAFIQFTARDSFPNSPDDASLLE